MSTWEGMPFRYDMASRLLERNYRRYGQQSIADSDRFTNGHAGRRSRTRMARWSRVAVLPLTGLPRSTIIMIGSSLSVTASTVPVCLS